LELQVNLVPWELGETKGLTVLKDHGEKQERRVLMVQLGLLVLKENWVQLVLWDQWAV